MRPKNGRAEQDKYGRRGNQQDALILFAVLVLAALSIDWPLLNPLIFSIALTAFIVGVMAILSFLRDWPFAWRIFLILATLTTLLAAILTIRLS